MIFKIFGDKKTDESYEIVEGAYAIIFNEAKKLTVIRAKTGDFLVGGQIEKGESHKDCILREGLEEIGCLLDINNFVTKAAFYGFAPNSKRYLFLLSHFYLAKIKKEKISKTEKSIDIKHLDFLKINKTMNLKHQVYAAELAYQIFLRES